MTKRLQQTGRDLLLDVHARLPSIEGSLQALLGQHRELEHARECDRVTLRLAAQIIERLLKENDALRHMVGLRLTYERFRVRKI